MEFMEEIQNHTYKFVHLSIFSKEIDQKRSLKPKQVK